MPSTPQRPQAVDCRTCGSPNSAFDLYCGACGEVLTRLRWLTPKGNWRIGPARVAITQTTRSATIGLRNDSSLPVSLVLSDERSREVPGWLALEALRNKEVRLAPNSQGEQLEIPLNPSTIDALFESDTVDEAQRSSALECKLEFLTSLGTTFVASLLVARRPWVAPAAGLYRFLPVERLMTGGIEHTVTIHNDAAEIIEVESVGIEEAPMAPPPGYQRLSGRALVQPDPCLGHEIGPGATFHHRLRIVGGLPEQVAESPGWFAAVVRYRLYSDQESLTLTSELRGVVGRGPTLEVKGSEEFLIRNPDDERSLETTLTNPGQLPVQATRIEILRPRREQWVPAPEDDWLVVAGLEDGDILAAGEERTLQLYLQPRCRPLNEFGLETVERRIRVHHDGWAEADDRVVELNVVAELGRLVERSIGIDFGTSSSVVCMLGDEKSYPLPLEILEGGRPIELLASMLYFEGMREIPSESLALKGEDARFLFGEEAKGSAGLEPANLVRSFKAVVMRGQDEKYRFLKRDAEGRDVSVVRTPQQLLDVFIRELQERSEDNLVYLSPAARREAGLEDQLVTFRKAVFSHPVEVTDSMKEALMGSAHASGINLHAEDPEEFFNECCVDEATAAVLAYVDQRLDEDGRDLQDLERVLCFDMGGGTTDVAAVEVRNAALFKKDDSGDVRVTVVLCNKDGDRSFGGDHLDRKIATCFVDQVQQQSKSTEAPVVPDEVYRAIVASSRSSFQAEYKKRVLGGKSMPLEQGVLDQMNDIWGLAQDLLEAAERSKRRCSAGKEAVETISGMRWPRATDGPEAEAVRTDNFTVELDEAKLEEIVREEVSGRLDHLDSVVDGSGWDWPSVTTVLLTGQSVRSPLIQNLVLEHIRKRRGDGVEEPRVVGPESGFDPKTCVAKGAAVWGDSRTGGYEWLEIRRQMLEQLNFDLTQRAGRRKYVAIEGLRRGATFPARARLSFRASRNQLTLFRDRRRYVSFSLDRPVKEIEIEARSLTDIRAHSGEDVYEGRIHQ